MLPPPHISESLLFKKCKDIVATFFFRIFHSNSLHHQFLMHRQRGGKRKHFPASTVCAPISSPSPLTSSLPFNGLLLCVCGLFASSSHAPSAPQRAASAGRSRRVPSPRRTAASSELVPDALDIPAGRHRLQTRG